MSTLHELIKYGSFFGGSDGAIQAPAVAEVGQTIRVSRVNNDGKPIEWEAVDFPEGGGTQPDWNQNDPTKADYVKNRPFWADDPVETVLFDGTIVTVDGWTNDDLPFVVTEYMEYTVTFNGAVYESVGVKYKGFVYVGNPAIWIGDLSLDNGLPFAIGEGYDGEHSVVGVTICGDSHTLKIVEKTRKTHKLSGRYFDFPNPVRAVGYNYETDEMIVLRELERIDVVPKEMYNEMRRDDSIVLIDDGLHLPPENFAFITSIEEYLDVSNLSKGETVSMRLDSTSRVHYPSLCKGVNDFNSIFVVRLDDHQGGSTVLLNGALGANTLTPSGKLCLVQVLGHGDYAILQATVVAVFPTD